VDAETIRKLLDITAHAPTGVNVRAVQLTVIDNKETMDAFRDEIYALVESALPEEMPADDHSLNVLIFAVKDRKENGSDVIFRGAPHLVIASTPKANPCLDADPQIALAYFELMAQSMGLGTVWDGIFKRALLSVAPPFGPPRHSRRSFDRLWHGLRQTRGPIPPHG